MKICRVGLASCSFLPNILRYAEVQQAINTHRSLKRVRGWDSLRKQRADVHKHHPTLEVRRNVVADATRPMDLVVLVIP
jgi:hypothetical protein